KPRSSARNRHIPVSAFSTVDLDHVLPESGVEHDPVRVCDRIPNFTFIVPQPFRLIWNLSTPPKHKPDLLAVHSTGSVAVCDVRPADKQDEDFLQTSTAIGGQCSLRRQAPRRYVTCVLLHR